MICNLGDPMSLRHPVGCRRATTRLTWRIRNARPLVMSHMWLRHITTCHTCDCDTSLHVTHVIATYHYTITYMTGSGYTVECAMSHALQVHCSVLQCVAVCCSVLQCVAVCCSVLQWVTACCSTCCRCSRHVTHVIETHHIYDWVVSYVWMRHVTRVVGALQCIAVHCSVVQCVAVCWSVLQCVAARVVGALPLRHIWLWCICVTAA